MSSNKNKLDYIIFKHNKIINNKILKDLKNE
jgi:hypothetical protein